MGPERKLQEKVLRWLRARPNSFTVKIAQRYHAGLPDIYHAERGRSWWIELKAPGKSPTKLQRLTLEAIQNAQVEAFWTDNLEEIKRRIAGEDG